MTCTALKKSAPPNPAGHHQSGFTIVELMVASTLSLLILVGLISVFVNSNRARSEIERTSQQIENGRYAAQIVSYDLRNTGYLAEFDPRALATPASEPDVCASDVTDLKTALPLHVQGIDDGSSTPSCLSDVRENTDILVVRRASTCAEGTANCDAPSSNGKTYFQASLCSDKCPAAELSLTDSSNWYAMDTSGGMTLHKKDGTTVADIYRYRTHIYFIANNNISGDGIPTLKRAELGAGGFIIAPLVEGIENLQIEYGLDTDATKDGAPNVFTADPGSYNSCSGAACVENWRNVVSARIYLLARNTQLSGGFTDSKTYTLGLTAGGANKTVGPFNDSYRRHVYQASVRLNNPAGRSSTP